MEKQEIKESVVRFINDEDGATAIEYGLFASLIALIIIGAVTNIGLQLQTTFTNICTTLNGGQAC